MTPTAVTFLVLAALIIWGGLAASIVRLRRDAASAADAAGRPADGAHRRVSDPPSGGAQTIEADAD